MQPGFVQMPVIHLNDRALVRISGADAEHFLQNLITPDLGALAEGEARPGALLSPQGKILFDFLISRSGDGAFVLDCRADVTGDLMRRLMLYKLRAKVDLSLEDQAFVTVSWETDSGASDDDSTALADRRFPAGLNVRRHYGASGTADADVEAWSRLRVAHGVAESGEDYALSDAFPHDILFDQNDGVGIKKGCYVGQEVVSRMHHRGTARRRLVILRAESPLPATGTEVTADGRAIGALGTVCEREALAILRIDRAAEAMETGIPILAGETPASLHLPAYARFALSSDSGQEQA
jgi:tRNA-modifying protein YgfZ